MQRAPQSSGQSAMAGRGSSTSERASRPRSLRAGRPAGQTDIPTKNTRGSKKRETHLCSSDFGSLSRSVLFFSFLFSSLFFSFPPSSPPAGRVRLLALLFSLSRLSCFPSATQHTHILRTLKKINEQKANRPNQQQTLPACLPPSLPPAHIHTDGSGWLALALHRFIF